jgi:signal transduction histidine kinase
MEETKGVTNKTVQEEGITLLLKSLPDTYLFFSPSLKIIAASQSYLNLLHLSEGDLLNKAVWEVFPDTNCLADEVSFNSILINSLEKVLVSKSTSVSSRKNVTYPENANALKARQWQIVNIPVLNAVNEVIYIVHKINEVAKSDLEAKNGLENSERFHSIAKIAPTSSVFMYNKDLIITFAEGAETEDSKHELSGWIGKNINEIYISETEKDLVNLFRQSLLGIESTFEKEINNKSYKIEVFPVLNSLKEVFAGMMVLQEITDIRQSQKELEIKIDKLNRSNEELEQFAYVASHDLQEPLRKIRAFGERLASRFKAELGDDGKDYIDRMQNAASRMQILIDNLLAYSKLSRSKEENIEVDLDEIVKEVLIDLEITIEQKKAKIVVDKLPVIMAIKGQMRQLFQNLISNALKFNAPNKVPQISITSEVISGKDFQSHIKNARRSKYCRIVIQDSGIGFEEKFLDRIFVIFQRLHGRSEYAGTGIGLAICKKIVENHNGAITAKSQINEGSSFVITLPLINT